MNIVLRSLDGSTIGVGSEHPTRVASLIGANSPHQLGAALRSLEALRRLAFPPDIVADLSIGRSADPLWRHVVRSGLTASTLPVYSCKARNGVIDPLELLDIATEQMEGGVGLLTIHPTPTRPLISSSSSRLVPATSRGGGIVSRDLLMSLRKTNAYVRVLPEIISVARRTRTAISIGASFRSANVFDSNDTTQRAEIDAQISLAQSISSEGVDVVIESPGHARPTDIEILSKRLQNSGFPIMPLGPMPIDSGFEYDHVAAAIGAALMGIHGAAHILAAVTREEHSGGIPSATSIVEAAGSARIAARVIDTHRFGPSAFDRGVAEARARHRTCIVGREARGCSRCARVCPL
jgi:phosphomethylpyrimidine synthase